MPSLKGLMENIETDLIYETDHNLLNLCFPLSLRDNALIWLLGQYLEYVENEVMVKNLKISREQFGGWLLAKYSEAKSASIPYLGLIPGIYPMGVG